MNIDKLSFLCEICYIEMIVIKMKDIIISDDIM